ncbi:MAG: RlmE family RNA methyltransferase [Deltaproteobacteria bacterium]|nr:RlmE family RNA methyltransferase [Deltaproteobacteria bacterium]
MAKKQFERKDRFYNKAKKEGYPARSAYKIMELDDRFKIFKSGATIIDLGCAPGGWLKVAEERLKGNGTLIGIDLLPLKYPKKEGTLFIQGDFTAIENQHKILERAHKGASWVISDLSPNISGVKFRDRFGSYELCLTSMLFAAKILKTGGNFLCKLFPGGEVEELRRETKKYFKKLVSVVPEATRQSSTEIYLVALSLNRQQESPQ